MQEWGIYEVKLMEDKEFRVAMVDVMKTLKKHKTTYIEAMFILDTLKHQLYGDMTEDLGE